MKVWAESARVMLGPACDRGTLATTGAPVLRVAYEDLKAGREAALATILDFLGMGGGSLTVVVPAPLPAHTPLSRSVKHALGEAGGFG
jgi:hypothetical protein